MNEKELAGCKLLEQKLFKVRDAALEKDLSVDELIVVKKNNRISLRRMMRIHDVIRYREKEKKNNTIVN